MKIKLKFHNYLHIKKTKKFTMLFMFLLAGITACNNKDEQEAANQEKFETEKVPEEKKEHKHQQKFSEK